LFFILLIFPSVSLSLFFQCYSPLRYLHSFPTRRSSDLFFYQLFFDFKIGLVFAVNLGISGISSFKENILGTTETSPQCIIFFARSEEHTSELQSRFDLVCRLLLEKKNRKDDMRSDPVQS